MEIEDRIYYRKQRDGSVVFQPMLVDLYWSIEVARGFHGTWRELRKGLTLLVRWVRAAWAERQAARAAQMTTPVSTSETSPAVLLDK